METSEILTEQTASLPATQEEMQNTDAEAESPATTLGAPPYLTVKFNHLDQHFTLDEATEIIQKSLKNESSFKKLAFLANESGQTVERLVDAVFEEREKAELGRLEEEYSGNPEGLLSALIDRKNRHEQAFMQSVKATEGDGLYDRLALEFTALKKAFPEVSSVDALSDEVLFDAASGKGSLLECYLLSEVNSLKAENAALRKREENGRHTLPSLSSGSTPQNPLISSLLRGLRR